MVANVLHSYVFYIKDNAMIPVYEDCALLVIDMQDKLLDTLPADVKEQLVKNVGILIDLMKDMEGSVFYTEQNPEKLGGTTPILAEKLKGAIRVEKMSFSCFSDGDFCERVAPHIPQTLIIVGVEAHICVLMTTLDLIQEDEEEEITVFVPIDGTASRKKSNWKNAILQMSNLGVITTNTETLVYQALEEAGTDLFRKYSKLLR